MGQPGIVYVLTNPAMPGLVKIGKTTQGTTEDRMSTLYNSSVPVPFECPFAARVQDADAAEAALHQAFAPYRVNPRREFFEIEPDQAIAILRLVSVADATPQIREEVDEGVDETSRHAREQMIRRRPSLNFVEMQIPVGATIVSTDSGETATIADERHVLFRGEHVSLTAATREILGLDYAVAPTPHWTFEGRLLSDIYEDTYRRED
jgi:hypothetical protein